MFIILWRWCYCRCIDAKKKLFFHPFELTGWAPFSIDRSRLPTKQCMAFSLTSFQKNVIPFCQVDRDFWGKTYVPVSSIFPILQGDVHWIFDCSEIYEKASLVSGMAFYKCVQFQSRHPHPPLLCSGCFHHHSTTDVFFSFLSLSHNIISIYYAI